MDLFYKKTDIRRCVPITSCHPKYLGTNIPFTSARRICTVVENKNTRQTNLKQLEKVLINQEYL